MAREDSQQAGVWNYAAASRDYWEGEPWGKWVCAFGLQSQLNLPKIALEKA